MNSLAPYTFYLNVDGVIILLGCLSAFTAAILGHFLLLRKMSMLCDAISHSVLPGIAISFILFKSRGDVFTLIFASLSAVILVLVSEYIRKKGRVDESSSLGISFITLFAIGLILISYAADYVDLDPACVLYGNIELAPLMTKSFLGYEIPEALFPLFILFFITLSFVIIFYKELILLSFDEVFAEMQSSKPRVFNFLFLALVSITSVFLFNYFGTVLVLVLFILPAACAHLISRSSINILLIAVVLSFLFIISGHLTSVYLPHYFGFKSLNTSSMIAFISGSFFTFLLIFSPTQGLIFKKLRKLFYKINMRVDDYLASLYRETENGVIRQDYFSGIIFVSKFLGLIKTEGSAYKLTNKGYLRAKNIVRNHRLWETYLSDEVGYDALNVHPHADGFEHYTNKQLQEKLSSKVNSSNKDPHGKEIP